MVHARLHVICGNCGCNDQLSYHIDPKGHDITNTTPAFSPAVYLRCGNCSTLHDLSCTVPQDTNNPIPVLYAPEK